MLPTTTGDGLVRSLFDIGDYEARRHARMQEAERRDFGRFLDWLNSGRREPDEWAFEMLRRLEFEQTDLCPSARTATYQRGRLVVTVLGSFFADDDPAYGGLMAEASIMPAEETT